MEVSELRRRVRAAIESARKTAQERRARTDQAARDYEIFLRERAVPIFQTFASALAAEGHRFKVHTPADSVRLASENAAEDYIELAMDSTADPPAVVGRVNRGRGRRLLTSEAPLKEHGSIADISEDDIVSYLLTAIAPLIER